MWAEEVPASKPQSPCGFTSQWSPDAPPCVLAGVLASRPGTDQVAGVVPLVSWGRVDGHEVGPQVCWTVVPGSQEDSLSNRRPGSPARRQSLRRGDLRALA